MSQLPELKSSLVRAAARQYPVGGRARRSRSLLSALPVTLAVLVAVAVAAVALVVPRHATHTPATSGVVSSRLRLINTIAVLRRPQTTADLDYPRSIARNNGGVFRLAHGAPDIPLIRYATTTPWGERLFFVPMKPPTAAALAAFERASPGLPHRVMVRLARQGETLGVFSSGGGGGGADAAQISASGMGETEGAGRSFAGGSTRMRIITVVPDGVAKVEYLLPRQPAGNEYGGTVYPRVLRITVPVHDNVAAVQVDRACCNTGPMVWYAPDGHVIKRIGNLAAANRVVASASPGPETPASRAAERDPSTPNRVWVTPTVGGPHTPFRIHFRVLLNGADYRYTFSGTRCPSFTFPGGTGDPNSLRGSLWSDPIQAVQGQPLCRGHYDVAVTVMDLGGRRNLHHPAHSFGAATFIVR